MIRFRSQKKTIFTHKALHFVVDFFGLDISPFNLTVHSASRAVLWYFATLSTLWILYAWAVYCNNISMLRPTGPSVSGFDLLLLHSVTMFIPKVCPMSSN